MTYAPEGDTAEHLCRPSREGAQVGCFRSAGFSQANTAARVPCVRLDHHGEFKLADPYQSQDAIGPSCAS
jgi:hypothetical protein